MRSKDLQARNHSLWGTTVNENIEMAASCFEDCWRFQQMVVRHPTRLLRPSARRTTGDGKLLRLKRRRGDATQVRSVRGRPHRTGGRGETYVRIGKHAPPLRWLSFFPGDCLGGSQGATEYKPNTVSEFGVHASFRSRSFSHNLTHFSANCEDRHTNPLPSRMHLAYSPRTGTRGSCCAFDIPVASCLLGGGLGIRKVYSKRPQRKCLARNRDKFK